ncbi:MAG: SIS domain-containing protein [Rhodospirillaceae bacterium]|jgi:D-sedoheptulose 7-phosphate isomerase|nr:SIS domain-containing protein [Rhodospirillaceae bacterium]MBT3928998.1 SIS domain-containing protein [Rhodospirillaceae bacterium]MBT4426339.1 SIS domain-containing protein [Rhodospirillaceae bacterium]MBT5037100.1 SIS domain-containing protein [Rhodospirillaceae bacterium]MBT5779557.1 SIS domain-containing protein [Rhodospirillaceae bacterium]
MSTFPERPYTSIGSYCDDYVAQLARAGGSIDHDQLAAAGDILNQAFERGAWLYVCGNGGSAAIANHLLCDFAKGIQTDTELLPRVISLSANLELITAIANDIAFEDCFVYQLRTAARPGDVLLTISSSGDSENIVRAVEWAGANEVQSIALTGFDGGRSARLAAVNIHVSGDNYGVVEDTHQSIMHIFSQYLRQARMSDSLITSRKF